MANNVGSIISVMDIAKELSRKSVVVVEYFPDLRFRRFGDLEDAKDFSKSFFIRKNYIEIWKNGKMIKNGKGR